MQSLHPQPPPSETVILTTRKLIHDESFCHQHRAGDKDFTRRRKLTFMNVVVMLLQKTVRSVQLHLHEFFAALSPDSPAVGASAWCEARLKLRHTAFIELNERAILEVVYRGKSDFAVRRWRGHRLIGIDSSLIRLPNQPALGQEFGWVACANQAGAAGKFPQARRSALTDLLNRIVLPALFVPGEQGERDLALARLPQLEPEEVALLDRGFAAYELWAQFTVRFVTVRLPTGALEVLATHLLDEQRYPTQEFGALYHCRRGIETYYGRIKGRLDLENFTGLSAEAVRQDLHATIFLSNPESVLTQPVQARLQQHSEPLPLRQQVNHAVSFHARKNQIIALLLSAKPLPEVLAKLERLFLANPVASRPGRKVPRKKPSAWRSYYYQRNRKKVVF